jgi:predicted dehydrogenase
LHYAQCRLALAAGKHVLVAKPITNDFAQAVELADLAKQKGVTLSVGQQIRYNRHYTAVREFIESGALGHVEAVWFMNSKPRPDPANLAKLDQPALYENACHHFDSLLAICGDPKPEWIACDGFNPSWSKYSGPCMVNALIAFAGGLHVSYHGGFSSQGPMYELRLEGTKGALRCRGVHMSVDAMSYEFAPALGQFAPLAIDADVPARQPFGVLFAAWHDYLNGGEEPPFSGRNNLKPFALLCAAIDAVQSKRPVFIADHPRYASVF